MSRQSTCVSVLAFAAALLAGCSGEPAAPAQRDADVAGDTGAAAPSAVPVTFEEVKFAYRCQGVLSAAWAASRALPAGEVPLELAQINLKVTAWWAGEVSRRDDAAGISEEQRAELVSGATRVFISREKLEEALPTTRECLAQMPK